jgi:hypothetical protein
MDANEAIDLGRDETRSWPLRFTSLQEVVAEVAALRERVAVLERAARVPPEGEQPAGMPDHECG